MPDLDEGIKLSDEALAEMIAAVYRGEWDIDAVAESRILDETRAIFRKAVDKGVPRSKAHRKAFKERLNESVDVFATFRVHSQAEDCARELTDEEGRRRTFRDWAERVQPYLNHQNRAWLQTEYNTAIRRAHDEAEWERFMEDADIYPNLEWMPSTSAQPGADHKIFWGTVLSKDDPFWSEHRPGDRWNCKCSLRQTDKEADKPGVRWKRGKGDEPQAGLKTKPGSGEIFSDDHPYFPKSCGACPYGSQAGRLRLFWHELTQGRGNCYNCLLRLQCEEKARAAETGKDAKKAEKSRAAKQRAKYMTRMEPLLDVEVEKEADGKTITIGFTRRGNKHLYSDALGRSKSIELELLERLDELLRESTYIGESGLTHPRSDGVDHFYYFKGKIRGKAVRLNVAERTKVKTDGQPQKETFLYSINDIKKEEAEAGS